MRTDIETIESLGGCELLCQLAEEASELSKAALKLRRSIDGKNPTPKSFDQCMADMAEEYADVLFCLRIVLEKLNWNWNDFGGLVDQIGEEKMKRWAGRIRQKIGGM